MADLRMDLPPNPTQDHLEQQLIYQTILMDALDPKDEEYTRKRAGMESNIEYLQKALGIDDETISQTMMSPGAMSQDSWEQMPLQAFEDTSNQFSANQFGYTDMSGMATNTNGARGDDFDWMLDSMYPDSALTAPSPSTNPTFTANVDTMSHKRNHQELVSPNAAAFTANKSMRPSPAATPPRPTTRPVSPNSDSSLEVIGQAIAHQNRAWQPGSGSSANPRVAAMIHEQREAETQAQKREQQSKARLAHDRKLAASLTSGSSFACTPSGSSQQTVRNRDGTIRRPHPHHINPYFRSEPSMNGISSSSYPMQPNQYAVKKENRSFKAEQPEPFPRTSQTNQVLSIGSDSDDSDIEVIDAEQFTQSSRSRQTSTQHASAQMYQHHLQPMYNNSGQNQPLSHQQSMINNGTQNPEPGDKRLFNSYLNGMPKRASPTPANIWDNGSRYWTDLFKSTNPLIGGFQENISSLQDMVEHGTTHRSNNFYHQSQSMPGAFPGAFNSFGGGFGGNTPIIDLDDDDEEEAPSTAFNYLYSDSSKTSAEIKALIENIAAGGDIPPEMRGNTPEGMVGTLFEHQKIGLKWLKEKEEGTLKGGILADDMGLGKTIQAIALMASRPSDNPARKTTLIIAPVALIRQWEAEIRDKLKDGHQMRVHKHHGGSKKHGFKELQQYDVVLTTFGTLASELKKKDAWEKVLKNNPQAQPKPNEALTLIGPECNWYRVIIDEAQCIKNKGTNTAKAAYLLKSKYRWCMTGTPMMNNVSELFSLVHFCRIKPYNDPQKFKSDIATPLGSANDAARERAMTKLQGLIKAVMLRRTKSSTLDGKPIITIPERTSETANVEFSEEEWDFYKALEHQAQLQFNKYIKQGSVMKNYANALVLLLRLRQACCHPHLIRDFESETNANAEISAETMDNLAKQLSEEVVARIKESEGNFECPICYDGVVNPSIFIPCGHDACFECFTRLMDPSRALQQGNETAEAKCPECRGKLDPKRIIDYTSFKKIYMPDHVPEHDLVGVANLVDDESDSDSDSECDSDEEDEDGTLSGFIVNDDEIVVEAEGPSSDTTVPAAATENKPQKGTKGRKRKSKKSKGKKKEKETKSLAQLRTEGLRNKKARRHYLRRLRKDYVTSAKFDKVLEILGKVHEVPINPKPRDDEVKNNGEKVLIFSQFTSLLDLLEIPIIAAQYQYTRYDGSMSPSDRNASVEAFKTNPNCRVMLVSLKAGNAGLNLIQASQVIILDPFWNPYIAEQAIDRAHRIGQRRRVNVHHVLVPGTVEDRIVKLQEQKKALISAALDENAGRSVGRLGERELGYLFGVHGLADGN
ncbi:swi snf family dna-dependent atpase [Venturia nashicola]|uniref:Swi snf family dna-dependent atpase n=1 Tax=Venturia nashicola TaxID=86259 RepID=A0A4Z1PH37_9PEZI|nr:swi snf family dna-dependent atpase [Venturia nashicola]TLD38910.1 swi snf family dna-dependent atpase [Venturia nashicola]